MGGEALAGWGHRSTCLQEPSLVAADVGGVLNLGWTMLRVLGTHTRLQKVLELQMVGKAVPQSLGQLQNSSRQQQGLLF